MILRSDIGRAAAILALAVLSVYPGACADRGEEAGSAQGASREAGGGPVVDGEKMTVRRVVDRAQGDLVVGVFVAPESWRDRSEVVWNYEHTSSPVAISMVTESPVGAEAVSGYPAEQFFGLKPDASFYKPGQNFGGLVYMRTRSTPVQALEAFVRHVRGTAPGLALVGSKELPDLPAALQIPPSKNQQGIGLKVTYDLDGKPVEEEFYAVYYSVDIPYDGPQGRTWQNNWGLAALHSFRAPRGTLDQRRAVFAAVAKSFRPNPAWQQRLAAINAYLQEQFDRQLKAGYDRIAAAAALSRQISANNDAMIASIEQQLAASRAKSASTTSESAAERNAVEKFDDYIRGVDTVDDPYYGTSQHSYDDKYHWTDGYGAYRNSNDSTYDPNHTEVGDWQPMKPSH